MSLKTKNDAKEKDDQTEAVDEKVKDIIKQDNKKEDERTKDLDEKEVTEVVTTKTGQKLRLQRKMMQLRSARRLR